MVLRLLISVSSLSVLSATGQYFMARQDWIPAQVCKETCKLSPLILADSKALHHFALSNFGGVSATSQYCDSADGLSCVGISQNPLSLTLHAGKCAVHAFCHHLNSGQCFDFSSESISLGNKIKERCPFGRLISVLREITGFEPVIACANYPEVTLFSVFPIFLQRTFFYCLPLRSWTCTRATRIFHFTGFRIMTIPSFKCHCVCQFRHQ